MSTGKTLLARERGWGFPCGGLLSRNMEGPTPEGPVPQAPDYSPYDRPITSNMISSVPAPIRFSLMSRQARSTPYSFM